MGCMLTVEGLDSHLVDIDTNPLSLHPANQWLTSRPMTIKMKMKLFSWSGDDYTIYEYDPSPQNKNGHPLLKIDGKAGVWNSLMHIQDLSGNLLMILDGKTQFLGYTIFHLKNGQQQTLAIITRDTSFGTQNFYVKSPDERTIYYTINGTFYNHQFVVRNRFGYIVGKSSRQITNSGYHSYGVQMCTGFDYVLMVMIMAAIDEYEEQQRSN
eukprot:70038_1